MGKKLYPTDTLSQAQDILIAWEQIDPELKIGAVSPGTIEADVARVKALQENIRLLKMELLNLRYERDVTCIGIWDKLKRVRAGIKSLYGDDSMQYELAGGTRQSERKKPRRSPALPALAGPVEGPNPE
jgi:hypothetical protein